MRRLSKLLSNRVWRGLLGFGFSGVCVGFGWLLTTTRRVSSLLVVGRDVGRGGGAGG